MIQIISVENNKLSNSKKYYCVYTHLKTLIFIIKIQQEKNSPLKIKDLWGIIIINEYIHVNRLYFFIENTGKIFKILFHM